MILMQKDLDQIMQETLDELKGMSLDANPGSVTRLILNIMNQQINAFYETFTLNHAQAFVSKAKGSFLDQIGMLLNCQRLPEEAHDDDGYRFRITKQIQVVASANEMAVRLAALSVDGVQDVKMKRFTHGSGSFSVYVVSESPITPDFILQAVQQKIDEVESFGVRGVVFRPELLPVDMSVRLIFKKTVSDLERKLAVAKAQETLKTYVNSRNVGEALSVALVKSELTNIHEGITDLIIYNFKVKNRPALPVNQTCAWNERFIESDKPNALMVS